MTDEELHILRNKELVGDFMVKNGWKIGSIKVTEDSTISTWKHPMLDDIKLTISNNLATKMKTKVVL